MTQDEKHAVALMRYGAIAPLISGTKDDFQSLDDYYREAAEKSYPAPNGSTKHFSAASIERWYRSYLKTVLTHSCQKAVLTLAKAAAWMMNARNLSAT